MNKIIALWLIILLTSFNIINCSSESEFKDCEFSIDTITNGTDLDNVISFWSCLDSESDMHDFSIFENGTGLSSDIGAFTWIRTGCNSMKIQFSLGAADILEIELTDEILSFFIRSEEVEFLDGRSNECEFNLI